MADYASKLVAGGLYAKHPRPNVTFTYGTAGFRMEASLMDSVVFNVGLLAALRSKAHKGKVIGVMITASHNPAKDNGVKLVEPLGEMLVQTWESYATDLANATSVDAAIAAIKNIVEKEGIDITQPSKVIVARDTRPSGKALVDSLKDGVDAFSGAFTDYGLQTTPQLHYLTRCLNTLGTSSAYGEPSENGYYQKLATAFRKISAGRTRLSTLHVDAANGIGATAMIGLMGHLGDSLEVKLHNTDTADSEKLNKDSGADFVKVGQNKPLGMSILPGDRACSLDGDADRIVYYYINNEGTFKLLDGDKIATLAASFIIEHVNRAGVTVKSPSGEPSPIRVGLVQTAYANGSSTSYVRDGLKIPVVFTPTGVKHLHHEAEHFDVGVYFEANGHGTVLFSEAAQTAFKTTIGQTDAQKESLEILKSLAELINQTVGDALSDMLLVEAILTCQQKSLAEWDADYTDLPSRQEKVKVQRRSDFVPIKADTELAAPAGLQEKINQQVAKFTKGRCFVRPSGTEDIVRVYAEAATRDETELLTYIVCGIVFDGYGGVGERPVKFKKVDASGDVV
ncbi:Phosphoacetylglucosamine Mutase [Dinochytrium kinnereticum]|nr:Phosphoacetylglucosamine Mutase [Dinochytrium kinnereticum]